MILRILAYTAILSGCGYMGIVFDSCSKKRTKQLGEFRNALKQLEFDVDFLSLTLCESFEKITAISGNGVKQVFAYILKRLRENPCTDMKKCWEYAFEIYAPELFINEDDKKILMDFAKSLGTGDRKNEINNIKAADMRLKIAENDARSEAEKNSKMYRGLGFLCGIFIVIILM